MYTNPEGYDGSVEQAWGSCHKQLHPPPPASYRKDQTAFVSDGV